MPPDPATDRLFARLTWGAVGVGMLVRLVRFALPFPLWGDEVFVWLNNCPHEHRPLGWKRQR